MNKKIAALGEKTNLKKEEVKKLTKIGVSGLLALAVAVLTGLGSNVAQAKEAPQKCAEVPTKSDCKALFTTYYYDQAAKKCVRAMGCVSSVFDTQEECDKACGEQKPTVRPHTGHKYGGPSLEDFKDAK